MGSADVEDEDYHITPYIGEFINTLSSLGYVYLGACGIYNNAHRSTFWTFLPAYSAIILVGIGSALCHATLKYAFQLVDDLSMLLAAASVLYMILTFPHPTPPSQTYKLSLTLTLSTLLSLVVYRHISTGDSALHQIAFVVMIWVVGYRTLVLINRTVPNVSARKTMRRIAAWGAAAIVAAWLLWLVDIYYCTPLRQTREVVGLPWAFLLELHGWWHILTGIGVYIFMLLIECVHLAAEGKGEGKESFAPRWEGVGWWPHRVRFEKLERKRVRLWR